MRRSGGVAVALATALLLAIGGIAASEPAQALDATIPTTVSFDAPTATVAFGSDWIRTLRVAVPTDTGDEGGPRVLDTEDGAVDVYLVGQAAPFAVNLTVYRGGRVYLSQSSSQPLLGAGDHQLTAIFRPTAGSGLLGSQTSAPAALTVTALKLTQKMTLVSPTEPTVSLSLSGDYIDALGVPAGEWKVTATGGSPSPSSVTVTAPGDGSAATASLADAEVPGATLSIRAEFVPDPSVASGIESTKPTAVRYDVPAQTLLGFLGTPLGIPLPLLGGLGLLLLALIVAAIIVIIRTRRREVSFRATSRVLLIDPRGAVLMFLQYGKNRELPPRWITPGGGVDPGENHDQAAIRELREETGKVFERVPAPFLETDFAPDQRWHPYRAGHWAWYDIRVDRFEPSRSGWTDDEIADVVESRWMTADQLDAEARDGHEVEPPELPAMLRARLTP